jgi:4-hydroxy-tetrahydrodipicolinate reductase
MIRVIHVGVGPVGQRLARYAAARKELKIVGAVDPAPDKVGRDLGELCGIERLGVQVHPNLASALRAHRAHVALLTTVSSLERIRPQVEEIAAAGLDIVSTCEEMVYPWKTRPALARAIDAACSRHGATALSTGVNPGFLMDFLPLALTGVCQSVEKVRVQRIQDASVRRVPFQQKIGAGLTPAEFRKKKAEGTLRHVGLTESMHMIAARLGWKITRTVETLNPVMATRRITGGYVPIEPGMAAGVEQIGRAFINRREVITLEFRAAVGEPESFDRIEITGEPNISSTIAGGVNGDTATCAIVLNSIPAVLAAEPGLKTMVDLPIPAWM